MRRVDLPYLLGAFLYHNIWFSKHISDEKYLKILYKGYMGKQLDISNPKSFNEKMQWLKLYDRNPQYTDMADKIEVKKYVERLIGPSFVIPTLGVWNTFEEINFSNLPNQFVLKCSHDSGGLVICRDKKSFDVNKARLTINKSLKRNYFWPHREWPYKNIQPRILAEKYMEDKSANDDSTSIGLIDYKFFCFNGVPQLLYISKGLENHYTAGISFYGMDGVELAFHRRDYKPYHGAVIPSNFTEMKNIAEKLAQDIESPFVRIDLYSVGDKSYFSEITFTPCGGMVPFEPESADYDLGKKLTLPITK